MMSSRPSGGGPMRPLSPESTSTLRTPRALAPSISDCSVARVRSRPCICMTGSAPCCRAIVLQARLDMRAVAEGLSVKLTAAT